MKLNITSVKLLAQNKTILIVEDDELVRMVLKDMCSRFFLEVYTAADGIEGLAQFIDKKPDMVMSDMMMPRMDGLALVRAIRELDPYTPIFLLTAMNDQVSFEDSLEAGIDVFLNKPIEMDLFVKEMYIYLKKLTEIEKLRDKEKFLDTLFNLSHDCMAMIDLDGNYLECNAAYAQMSGYSREELYTTSCYEISLDKDSIAQKLKTIQKLGYLNDIEKTLITKEGRTVNLLTSFELMLDKKRILCSSKDITKKNSLLNELEKAEKKFRFLFDQSLDGIVVIDPKSNLPIEFNTKAHSMLGYSREEYSSLKITDIDVYDTLDDVQMRKNLIHTKSVHEFETRHRHKSGSILDILVTATEIMMDQAAYILVTYRDTTEENTKQKKLIGALEDSEEMNKTKDIFLASMSHEIRTPLNGIIGLVEILSHSPLNEEQKKHIEVIKNSSSILKNLVNDILDYSKIQAGQMELEKISFSPIETIVMSERIFRHQADQKNIFFRSYYEVKNDVCVYGDSNRYTQILNNILGNAFKFTENGSVTIHVSALVEDYKSVLTIKVQDTGIGMTQEQMNMVFNPFKQASLSHTRKYGGTGLGLSISKQLVELMGGEIVVESEYGSGSCFSVTIPFENAQIIEAEEKDDLAVFKSNIRFDGSNKSILIVDDSETNLLVIEGYLSFFGLNCDKAKNGVEAIEQVNKKVFDLIFMDIHMPIMSGLDASKEIKKTHPKLPIVALSAAVMERERAAALEIGINDYLTKPIELDELSKVLNHYLNTDFLQITDTHSEVESSSLYGINIHELKKKFPKQEKLMQFLRLFVDEYKSISNELENINIHNSDLYGIIHKIKGSAGNGSMEQLFSLCEKFEASIEIEVKNYFLGAINQELCSIIDSIEQLILGQKNE